MRRSPAAAGRLHQSSRRGGRGGTGARLITPCPVQAEKTLHYGSRHLPSMLFFSRAALAPLSYWARARWGLKKMCSGNVRHVIACHTRSYHFSVIMSLVAARRASSSPALAAAASASARWPRRRLRARRSCVGPEKFRGWLAQGFNDVEFTSVAVGIIGPLRYHDAEINDAQGYDACLLPPHFFSRPAAEARYSFWGRHGTSRRGVSCRKGMCPTRSRGRGCRGVTEQVLLRTERYITLARRAEGLFVPSCWIL